MALLIDTSCPNEVATFLAEGRAEQIQDRAVEIISEWIASLRDTYAAEKADRELRQLREDMLTAVLDENENRSFAHRQAGEDARAEMAAERRAAA